MPPERKPEKAAPRRIETLAVLPVFLKLAGRRVVLAGGDEGAAWKAELLAASGAHVDVYATEPCEAMEALAADPPAGAIDIHRRPWSIHVFDNAAIAIGGAESDDEALAFRCAAQQAGVPVNCIDRPAFCDFQFGSIVNRSPLVIGISTDGAAPVFGQAIRARIETLIPATFKAWAQAARDWRPFVQQLDLPFRARRAFWERFTARALAAPTQAASEAEREAMLAATVAEETGRKVGSVALVGAGPGDPELMTLKGVRLLQSADVILYDDLVHPAVIDMGRREARLIHVGKRGYKPSCTQEDINGLIVELALEGLSVVRLKGGDPMVFGRAGEEIEACRRAGVPVAVVPGITAASGAAASLSVSLTHRDAARRLQFITAHARDGKLPRDLDWRALADPAATTAVYMGVRTLPELIDKLTGHGLPGTTPVMIVERATRDDERIIAGRADDIAARLAAAQPKGPCVVLIGEALAEARTG